MVQLPPRLIPNGWEVYHPDGGSRVVYEAHKRGHETRGTWAWTGRWQGNGVMTAPFAARHSTRQADRGLPNSNGNGGFAFGLAASHQGMMAVMMIGVVASSHE